MQRYTMAIATVLVLVVGGSAAAQDRTYLSIPGVVGGSTDATHMDWIDAYGLSDDRIRSYNPDFGGGGGTPLGPMEAGRVFVLKGTDLSSPALYDLLSRGNSVSRVTIEVCREPSGGAQECYHTLELENAYIFEIRLSGSSCVDPQTSCVPSQTESVAIGGSIMRQTTRSFSGGSVDQTSCSCWDFQRNEHCNSSCP